ncbi:MAG: hypothetical protein IPM18_06320 [Phycisphaerales bacterium]|nr:hypothetical protein [Phycisphaerales bacterium]
MTAIVGLILIAAFLTFAVLLFLERLSALLALPLMALTFLLVATTADVLQPARLLQPQISVTVDEFGRPTRAMAMVEQPTRFAQWVDLRHNAAARLATKAALYRQTVTELRARIVQNTDEAALRAQVAAAAAAEAAFDRETLARLAPLQQYFTREPHDPGPLARFRTELRAIAMTSTLSTLVTLLDEGQSPDGPAVTTLLTRAASDAERAMRRHAPPSPAETPAFRVRAALDYLGTAVAHLFRAGSLRLSAAIIATIFGGMFAMYVKNLKVAERAVYWTAEYAGEHPLWITLAVFLVTAGIFTSIGGLGTVIMLGTIILPILRSIGLGPIVAAGTFLLAISMGGTLQPVSRRMWLELYGIPAVELDRVLWTMVGVYFACGLGWICWGTRRRLLSSFQSEAGGSARPAGEVPARLMVAPLFPVALVYFGGVEEITAFSTAIVYMFVCVCRRPGAVRILARSLIEGAQTVMPPVLLMLGIGMLVGTLETAPVQSALHPLLSAVVPNTQLGYIVLFGLAAPLALYRGPLSVWGMGLAVAGLLLATSPLPPVAILGALLAAGMLQGVCDPTNTANVWIAGFLGVTVNQILRYTLLPVWAAAIVAVVIFGLRYLS